MISLRIFFLLFSSAQATRHSRRAAMSCFSCSILLPAILMIGSDTKITFLYIQEYYTIKFFASKKQSLVKGCFLPVKSFCFTLNFCFFISVGVLIWVSLSLPSFFLKKPDRTKKKLNSNTKCKKNPLPKQWVLNRNCLGFDQRPILLDADRRVSALLSAC